MTGTVRVDSGVLLQPSTQFYLSGDLLQPQSIANNSSTLRCYLRSINRGNSTSNYNNIGTQQGRVDYTTFDDDGDPVPVSSVFHTRTTNPFLPSGYGTGAQRWEVGPFDVVVPHEPDGTRTIRLRMLLNYGNQNHDLLSDPLVLPRIPRGPLIGVDGVPKNSIAYVGVDGVPKVAIAYVGVDGVPKIIGG